jgi:hypothetical protein
VLQVTSKIETETQLINLNFEIYTGLDCEVRLRRRTPSGPRRSVLNVSWLVEETLDADTFQRYGSNVLSSY